MHDRFSRRIEAALERLAARIARSKKPLDPAAVNRQIGRILQRNQRAAARFAIALQPDAQPGGLSPRRRLQRRVRRLGGALGRRLSAALEHRRLERSAALEGLHPAHPGRGRLPHPEGSAERPPDLAPARGSRAGPHPRLLPRLRAVEEPRDVAEPRRSGQLAAHHPRRTRAHPVARRRVADRNRTARFACAASPNPMPLRPHCSIASASSCPSACASPSRSCRLSP